MERKLQIFNLVMWILIAAALILLMVFFMFRGPWYQRFNLFSWKPSAAAAETYDKTFASADITKICVGSGAADITVKQSDTGDIRVIHRSSKDIKDSSFSVQTENGTLNIQDNNDFSGIHLFMFSSWTEQIEIDLPRSFGKAFSIENGSGDVIFTGGNTFAELSIQTGSGDFTADNIKAQSFSLKTGSGDIHVENLNAAHYDAESGSGDIRFNDLAGCGRLKASSGEIEARCSALTGDLTASTGSGDVKLSLPENTSEKIQASTGSGDINSSLPLSYTGWDKNTATGTVGSGPFQNVEIHTGSGDINLNK
ncbi:MAG TPA: DUF4097 domain-containing protein [Clostridia bacterium]|nr:DUF4097 domain-containing protein [Clostridia bacterium]